MINLTYHAISAVIFIKNLCRQKCLFQLFYYWIQLSKTNISGVCGLYDDQNYYFTSAKRTFVSMLLLCQLPQHTCLLWISVLARNGMSINIYKRLRRHMFFMFNICRFICYDYSLILLIFTFVFLDYCFIIAFIYLDYCPIITFDC